MPVGSESDAKQRQTTIGLCFQGQLAQQHVRVSPAGQVSGGSKGLKEGEGLDLRASRQDRA
jgi:hypothetical protein